MGSRRWPWSKPEVIPHENLLRAATNGDLKAIEAAALPQLVATLTSIGIKTLQSAWEHAQEAAAGNDAHCNRDYRRVGGVPSAAVAENLWFEKWGDEWEKKVAAHLRGGESDSGSGGHVCVTELIDHMMLASAELMASTAHEEDWCAAAI